MYYGDRPFFPLSDTELSAPAIKDDTKFVDLFIPGTHDSGTKGGSLFAECQDLTLQGQLGAGIRAFDIRLVDSYDGSGEQFVYHGIERFDLELTRDILPAFKAFLENHPDEFVIAVFRKEDDAKGRPEHYAAYIKSLTEALTAPEFSPIIYRGTLTPETTISELRGKLVLISRNELTPGFPAGKYDGFPNDASGHCRIIWPGTDRPALPTFVEDAYKVSDPFAKSDKINDLRAAMEEAAKAPSDELNVLFLSGTGLASPISVARVMNKEGLKLLEQMPTPPPGIYFMDFAGSDDGRALTGKLLSLNLLLHGTKR